MLFFSAPQDPLVHHGRHFGRAVHAFCNIQTLITNGLTYLADTDQVSTAKSVYISVT